VRKRETNYNEIESLISPGVVLKGELSSQGSIRVDGSLEGRMFVKGSLLLGEKGTIKGDVQAANMILAGHVEGTVTVAERLDITSTGVMLGDISARIITIEEGGMIQGNTQMPGAKPGGEPESAKSKPGKNK